MTAENTAAATPETVHPPASIGDRVIAQLKTVMDPEIQVNIYDLGLIYNIDIQGEEGGWDIKIDMTLTTPNCPVADNMPFLAESALRRIEGVKNAAISLVWDPPWDPSRMSDEARMILDMF